MAHAAESWADRKARADATAELFTRVLLDEALGFRVVEGRVVYIEGCCERCPETRPATVPEMRMYDMLLGGPESWGADPPGTD